MLHLHTHTHTHLNIITLRQAILTKNKKANISINMQEKSCQLLKKMEWHRWDNSNINKIFKSLPETKTTIIKKCNFFLIVTGLSQWQRETVLLNQGYLKTAKLSCYSSIQPFNSGLDSSIHYNVKIHNDKQKLHFKNSDIK